MSTTSVSMTTVQAESGPTSITVTPASPAVGAEIGNVDIAAGVSDEQFAEIRQAFVDYGVIFFRDQHLTEDQHIEWAERWSTINVTGSL